MDLSLLPTLAIQRELYGMPRGFARFQAYLATMTGGTDDLALPLVGMNPMGKDHLPALLDELIGFDAEQVAAKTLAEIMPYFAELPNRLRVALVITDDLMGGWTNRTFSDAGMRLNLEQLLKREFAVVPIWSSEEWTPQRIQYETRAAVFRSTYVLQHGTAQTLGEILQQEGQAMHFAGIAPPPLDADDIAYSQAVLEPLLNTTDYPTIIAALYGDGAAREVGYPPLGLSTGAGLAVAYHMLVASQPLLRKIGANNDNDLGLRG